MSDVEEIASKCRGKFAINRGVWAFCTDGTNVFVPALTDDDIIDAVATITREKTSEVRACIVSKGLKKLMTMEYMNTTTETKMSSKEQEKKKKDEAKENSLKSAKSLYVCNLPLDEDEREKCSEIELELLGILDPIIDLIRVKIGATNEPNTVFFVNKDKGLEEWRSNPDMSRSPIMSEAVSKIIDRLRIKNEGKVPTPDKLYMAYAEKAEPIFKAAKLVMPSFKMVVAELIDSLLCGSLQKVVVRESPLLLAWDAPAVVNLPSKERDSASDETPLFDSFCKRMNGDGDSFMAWVGAFFDPTATIRQVLWGHSDGQAGQSSFWTAFINGVLRPIVGVLETRKNSSRFSTSMLVGKRLAYISETDEADFLKNPAVKRLTGKDFARDERKGQDAKMVELWAQVAIIANIAPTVNTFDRAIMSRILYIKTSSLSNRETISKEEIEETYKKEFWGIVKKCCAKWEAAKRNGAVDGIPLTENNYKNLLLNCETDERKALRNFISKKLTYVEGVSVTKRDLYTHMADYMTEILVTEGNRATLRNHLYREREEYLMIIQSTLRDSMKGVYVESGIGSQDVFVNLQVSPSENDSAIFIPMAGQGERVEEIELDTSDMDL